MLAGERGDPHIRGMTVERGHCGNDDCVGEGVEPRRAACRALGIDFATVAWPSERAEPEAQDAPASSSEAAALSDEDWGLIAPLLPAEGPQANTMPNRQFLDAVLAAMRRGGAWTSRHTPAAEIEAVRRRFGRWAHQGVFQRLAAALPGLALSTDSARLIALAVERANWLQSRAGR